MINSYTFIINTIVKRLALGHNSQQFSSLGVELSIFMQFELVNLFLLILYLITVTFESTIIDTFLYNSKNIMREKIISPQ